MANGISPDGDLAATKKALSKKEKDALYREANRERLRKSARDRHRAKRDELIAKAREAYRKRAAADPDMHARRYAAEKERRKANATRWYWENRERVLARTKTDQGREAARQRESRKRSDPGYRLHTNISRAIRSSLGGGKGRRGWQSLLGYTLDDLKTHLERQFLKGMTWENYGDWHIDHIIPRSGFALTGEADAEFRACWALTNLRPLWAFENISKHGKRVFLV